MRDMASPLLDTRSEPSPPPISSVGEHMRISVCCNQGGRKYMEDRVIIHCEFTADGKLDYMFLAVFDGHGGADASTFAKQHLRHNIVKQSGFDSSQDSDVLEAIRVGFIETHEAMRKVVDAWPRTASGFTSTSGTTASVAFIRRGKLYIGHVGDSGIVLGSQKPTGELVGSSLTVEHKPDSPEEKKRIEEIGGEVMNKSGVMRVVWVRPLRGHQGPVRRSTPKEKIPFLAVARALGDLWSYNSDSKAFVVSPEPDVSVLALDSSHCCLVFGSDGLWNVLRPQHAVDIINSHEWKEDEISWMTNQREGYETNHARWIVRHALMRWGSLRADNISVISIILGNGGVAGSTYAKRVEPGGNTSIEDILISDPTSVISISPDRVIAIPTKPVELLYYGVSEFISYERQSYGNVNYFKIGSSDITTSGAPFDCYRIPGYTTYERGPPLGSLLSAGASSSAMGRYSVQGATLYRQYSSNAFNSLAPSSQSSSTTGKENGVFILPSITPVPLERTESSAPIIGNIEEVASEMEDESQHPAAASSASNQRIESTSTSANGVPVAKDQENGHGGGPCLLSNTIPFRLHGTAAYCSSSLVRAPLSQWAGATTTEADHPYQRSVTPPVSPAAIDMQLIRPTPDDTTSSLLSVRLYKCKLVSKHRRSCPKTPVRIYNTRRSCRTTRSGTKLSPQKTLFEKTPTAASTVDISKYKRRLVSSSIGRRSVGGPTPQPLSSRSRRYTSRAGSEEGTPTRRATNP